jgi:biotin--protein ligase
VLVASFLNRFEALKSDFDRDGFASFERAYYARWLHGGQRVTVEPHGAATIAGIAPTTGALLATSAESGAQLELFPDGNSFDFMRGLVSKKT